MGSLTTAQLICPFLLVATVAALGGFVASALTSRNKRRTRRVFLLGVFCGLLAGRISPRRCGRIDHFVSRTATFAASRARRRI